MFLTVIGALNEGFLQTLKLFFVPLVGALPLGLIISFGSMSRWAPLSRPIHWYLQRKKRGPGPISRLLLGFQPIRLICRLVVWVIRGTPLMLQLIIIFYIPGKILDASPWPSGELGRFLACAVAFIINYACYFSVIYRGGIQGVPAGQREAAEVLGLTKQQIFFKVTLLQMIKRIVPPMSNEIITLVKDTSLARIISVYELTFTGYSFMKSSGLVWPFFYTGVFYLLFVGILTILFNLIERKLSYFR